jgi:hypothetical protein
MPRQTSLIRAASPMNPDRPLAARSAVSDRLKENWPYRLEAADCLAST